MNLFPPPFENHGESRYMTVDVELIDLAQRAYLAGWLMEDVLQGIDADQTLVIVAETLIADRFWNLPLEELVQGSVPKYESSDFALAVVAEYCFNVAHLIREETGDRDRADTWWALAVSMLQKVLDSPLASPLIWYERIYQDLARAASRTMGEKSIAWLKQAMAHNLRYGEGEEALSILGDLAVTYVELDDLDRGIRMLTELLKCDPTYVWTYNVVGVPFLRHGLVDLGTEVVRRGLELLDAQGDPEELREQLEGFVEDFENAEERGREAEISPEALAGLRDVLALDFEVREPCDLEALAHRLVPDVDEMEVKRPMTLADVHLPDPDDIAAGQPQPPEQKPHRNAPCWCGSGKKYKYCHLQEDRRKP